MKVFILILSLLAIMKFAANVLAKNPVAKATFKVNGNCDSCKKRIEKAALAAGVKTAVWDEKTHLLTVTFIPSKITVDQIQQNVARSGHDTEKYKATEEDYKQLPQCCQYDRE